MGELSAETIDVILQNIKVITNSGKEAENHNNNPVANSTESISESASNITQIEDKEKDKMEIVNNNENEINKNG